MRHQRLHAIITLSDAGVSPFLCPATQHSRPPATRSAPPPSAYPRRSGLTIRRLQAHAPTLAAMADVDVRMIHPSPPDHPHLRAPAALADAEAARPLTLADDSASLAHAPAQGPGAIPTAERIHGLPSGSRPCAPDHCQTPRAGVSEISVFPGPYQFCLIGLVDLTKPAKPPPLKPPLVVPNQTSSSAGGLLAWARS